MPSASMLRGLRRRARPASAARPAQSRRAGALRRPRRLADAGVEGDLVAALDPVGEALLDLGERDRRGQQDAALRRRAGQFGHGEKRLARQRRCRIDIGAAAIGQQERAVRRRGSWRCGRDRRARGCAPADRSARLSCRARAAAASSAQRFAMRRASSPRRERSRRNWSSRCARSTSSPPSPRSVRIAAMSAARWPAPSAAASTTMRASRGGSGSARSLRPSSVMRPCASIAPSSRSSALRLGQRAGRRRIEKRERAGIGRAPLRQIEQQARQIGGQDFRPRIGFERRGLRLVPQPVADAGLGAAGAAAALVGGGARHPHGLEPRQADVGLVARHAREPAVDHDAHALDGERGLGDRGRQHHLAPARRRRRNRAILGLRVERAVQRHDVDRGIVDALLQQRLGAADFRRARQEHQHRAGIGAQRARHRVGHLPLDRRARVAAEIARLDRQTRGLRFRPPARRRAASRPARRRASPTSPAA